MMNLTTSDSISQIAFAVCVFGILVVSSLGLTSASNDAGAESIAGLREIGVVVVVSGAASDISIREHELLTEVRQLVRDRGLKIRGEDSPRQEQDVDFVVSLDVLDLGGEYVLHVTESRIVQMVTLVRNPEIKVDATTWRRRSEGVIVKDKASNQLTAKVAEHTRALLRDYSEFNISRSRK